MTEEQRKILVDWFQSCGQTDTIQLFWNQDDRWPSVTINMHSVPQEIFNALRDAEFDSPEVKEYRQFIKDSTAAFSI